MFKTFYKIFSSKLVLAVVFIVGWWTFAFLNGTKNEERGSSHIIQHTAHKDDFLLTFTPLSRDHLKQALAGDTRLMTKMISEWNVEAQILQSYGLSSVKQLSREAFVRSQVIGRGLKQDVDEAKESKRKFFPQTYVAASFLLSLLPLEEIVALPKGLRECVQIYPETLTDKILLDTDHFSSEKIFALHPDLAFVAAYSHPSTLQALEQQGVKLFFSKAIQSPMDVCEELRRIGQAVDKPLEAELLAIYLEAALYAIDNRILVLNRHQPQGRTLYLTHYNDFSVPGSNTLIGQLLGRLGINSCLHESSSSSRFLSLEQLVKLQPERIILSVSKDDLVNSILKKSAFATLPAVREGKVFLVDEAVQSTTSQYVVLAYYDLYQTLLQARFLENL